LSIKLLGKVVILTGLDGDLNHYEMLYTLPLSTIYNNFRY